MNYLQRQRNPLQSVPGFAAVAALHVALIYALMVGMRIDRSPVLPPPLPVHVLDRIVPPPPPPPPPSPTLVTPELTIPVPEITLPKIPELHQAVTSVQHSAEPPGTAPSAAPGPAMAAHKFTPAQIISGSRAPDYPASYEEDGRVGQVTVDCVIEATGVPSHCKILSSSGGGAFAAETLRWLTGASHPVYAPAVVDGKPRAEEHTWAVSFEAPQ